MSTAFPGVQIGDPIQHEQLSVFPLFAIESAPVEYALAADSIAVGSVVVEEVSEAGSVPLLSVTNHADLRVLFLEGEQLIGAKQNRILNTSILVAAKSKTTIPVSCVEQRRWRFKSKHFGSSPSYSPIKLRHALKASVSNSVKRGGGHTSDQSRVWAEVAKYQQEHGVSSETSALEDTFDSHRNKLTELQKQFAYVEGATGVAIALGKQVIAVDLFDKPATCRKVWDRLLSGVLLDSCTSQPTADRVGNGDVASFLDGLEAAHWEPAPAAGEGEEIRVTSQQGTQASALRFAGRIVHGSAVAV